jgi:hypothetical protein
MWWLAMSWWVVWEMTLTVAVFTRMRTLVPAWPVPVPRW